MAATATVAQPAADAAVDAQRRAQAQEAAQRQRLEPQPEVRLPTPPAASARRLPADETPCFRIDHLALLGDDDRRFGWLLAHADGHARLPQPDPVEGQCLGALGVQAIIQRLQDALVARGYVTSRVLAGMQNLQSGTLALTLVPGRVESIRWAEGTGDRASRWNTVPLRPGDLLELRALEQALENFQRVPTVQADIQLAPGLEPGASDLVITHRQARALRVAASLDDSGGRATGRYQGSVTASLDNLLTLSDLFYASLLRDLGGGEDGERGTRGWVAHFSLPAGWWLLSTTHSANRFQQRVAGASQDYVYAGDSRNAEFKATRIVHRDAQGRTAASVKAWRRASRNFIDDTEIEVQRRVVAGLEWGLNHRQAWPQGQVEAGLTYRRGTGAWGSLAAPEEPFGEGTSRMRLWLLDASVQQGFDIAGRRWSHLAAWRAQFNRTPLTPQDRFAIGGRYTVRGFDGEATLAAERGWLLRNDLSTGLAEGVGAFIAVDHGEVGGPSAGRLAGNRLTGMALGLRGQHGGLAWEAFAGTPLRMPAHFSAPPYTAGFSLAWSH